MKTLALMSAVRVTGTGHETTIAQAPRTDRVKASDQTPATAPALAMHRVVLGAERTAPAVATDTAQAMGPIASITPAAIQATRVARPAISTDRATATTPAIGTGRVIRVAATDTAQLRVTDTGIRDRMRRIEADTRRTRTTIGTLTGSVMASGRRTTTGETMSTRGPPATRRTRPIAGTTTAGRPRPTTTVTSGRTGPTPARRTIRSIRLVAGMGGKRIIAGRRKDSPATAMARARRDSTAR